MIDGPHQPPESLSNIGEVRGLLAEVLELAEQGSDLPADVVELGSELPDASAESARIIPHRSATAGCRAAGTSPARWRWPPPAIGGRRSLGQPDRFPARRRRSRRGLQPVDRLKRDIPIGLAGRESGIVPRGTSLFLTTTSRCHSLPPPLHRLWNPASESIASQATIALLWRIPTALTGSIQPPRVTPSTRPTTKVRPAAARPRIN